MARLPIILLGYKSIFYAIENSILHAYVSCTVTEISFTGDFTGCLNKALSPETTLHLPLEVKLKTEIGDAVFIVKCLKMPYLLSNWRYQRSMYL